MRKYLKEKHVVIWMILGLIYSLFYVFGKMFDEYGYIKWENKNFIWIALSLLLAVPISFLATLLNKNKKRLKKGSGLKTKEFIVIMLLNYICYFILIFGVFPGFFLYDAQEELLQVITRNFNAHHPILHVLYMGGIIQAGYKIFGTYNAGIFCFTLFQTLLFSYANTKILSFMKKRGCTKLSIIIAGVFLLGFPPLEMMALCSVKDSIFSLCVVLWIISYIENKETESFWGILKFIFWTIAMCMFRNNAIYAIIVLAAIIVLFYKDKRPALRVIIAIIIAVILNNALMQVFDAKEVGKQEMLTVPIQQVTRYYLEYDETSGGFNEEERRLLYNYLTQEYLNNYRPKVSDLVKIGFNNEYYLQNSGDFWRLWAKGLRKKPLCYINAWMMTCYGYFYPNASIDAYKGNVVFTFTYDESSYFGYETEEPGERHSFIQAIDGYFKYLSLEKVKDDNQILGLLLSPGLITWVYLGMFVFLITNKKERNEIPCIYLILVGLTLMLGPVCLPRYVFYLWYALPINMVLTFKG